MNKNNEQNLGWKRKTFGFLAGQGISLFGSQIVQMAIIWYVILKTSSGILVASLTLAAFLPQMIISLFAGVWADRYNRKLIIILSDAIIALSTLLLALFMMLGGMDQAVLIAIIIVSIIRSIGAGIQTPTVNAMLPQIVPEDNLSKINGYNGTIQSIVQFVSPIAAGAIMAIGPIYNILFIDVITAIIGISILALLKIPRHQPIKKEDDTSILKEMKEGLEFTWNNSFFRKLLMTYGLYIFLCVPSGFLTALMIKRTFGDNVLLLTINEAIGFAGAVIGGLLIGTTGGFKNRNMTFFLGMMIYGVASFAVGFTNIFWLFTVFMFFLGITIPFAQTAVFTLIQEKVESSMMGRVFSLVNIMFTGFMSLGMFVFGPTSDIVRIQMLVILCAVLIILLGFSIRFSKEFFKKGLPSLDK